MTETADWYRRFAAQDAHGVSPLYEKWALAIADDTEVLGLLEQLPLQKRQPNLLFGVARLLGAPEAPWREFREWLLENWAEVARETASRSTQANEPGRCAAMLPVLGLLEGPLALVDIGAAAGLCLYPDRYAYRYDDRPVLGNSPLVLECVTSGGVPVPPRLPQVVSRVGVDRDPMLVDRPDDLLWLETLIPPEGEERRQRLRAALEIAKTDPPTMFEADAIAGLAVAAAGTRPGARLVVVTMGVLVYLPYAERMRLVEAIRDLGCDWVSLEAPQVLPETAAQLTGPVLPDARFVLALNGRPVALTAPHGGRLHWLGDASEGAR
ncbi:MAG: DUF2332 domain-containing protein [Actinomycetota bacterium]|nr:DUF2332 domain-containing protein [Actinomycetota bacterium]